MSDAGSIPEFGIPRADEERRDGGCAVVFSPKQQKYAVGQQENGILRLFSGGVDEHESMEEGILREVVEESGLHDFSHVEKIAEAFTHYRNNLKNVNRAAHAHCYLVILKSDAVKPVQLEAHEKFFLTWASADEILKSWTDRNQNKDYDHWVYFMEKAVARAQELGYDKTRS